MFSAEALQVTADHLGHLMVRAMQLLRSVSVEALGGSGRLEDLKVSRRVRGCGKTR